MQRHNKAIYHLLLTAVFAIFLMVTTTACQQTPPVLKIALVAPFEGSERAIGYDAIYAARLAVREINQAGGINGYHIALVSLDDSGQPELATAVAKSLVLDEQIIAVVGHGTSQTTGVVQKIYRDADIPLIPLTPADPNTLSPQFHQAYEAVTPFDEQAGPYAGPTYQAFEQLFAAIDANPQPTRADIRTYVETQ